MPRAVRVPVYLGSPLQIMHNRARRARFFFSSFLFTSHFLSPLPKNQQRELLQWHKENSRNAPGARKPPQHDLRGQVRGQPGVCSAAAPQPPPRGGHGEARGLPPHRGTGPGWGGEAKYPRVPPCTHTPRGTPAEAAPPHPAVPHPAAPGPSLTPQGGHLVGAEGGGGGAPWRAAAAEQQQAARQEPQPHAQHRLSRHGSARPGPAPTRSSPRREPGPGEGGGATPPRGGRGERGSRPRSFPGRGAPPRARCPGRGWALRRPKGATRASFAVPGRFLVSALQAAFPKKSRVAQRRGRQENVGSAARVRRLAAPLLRVLRQTFTETWFLARSARQGTSHFWHGEK